MNVIVKLIGAISALVLVGALGGCAIEEDNAIASQDADLVIYSLHDNRQVRQAVATFEEETGLKTEIVVGIPEDSDVSTDDAIRALNASLVSDNCPDILVLDGLPAQNLVEKGLLLDLEEDKDDLLGADAYFEKVLKTTNPKRFYAVPTRFTVPVVMGSTSFVNDATTVSSLADSLKHSSDTETLLSPDNIIPDVYEASYPTLIGENGLSVEGTAGFLENLKVILSSVESNFAGLPPDQANYSYLDDLLYNFTAPNASISTGELFVTPGREVQIATLTDPVDFGYLFLTAQEASFPFSFELLRESKTVFTPNTILSVCANGTHQSQAKNFIAHMLSKDIQKQNQIMDGSFQAHSYGGGLPVNKDAFIESFEDNAQSDGGYGIGFMDDEDQEPVMYTIAPLSDEQIAESVSLIEGAESAVLFDQAVTEVVAQEFALYYHDEITLDEAVDAVAQTVDLYLKQ